MKRNLSLFLMFVLLLSSCSRVVERKPGDWDDNIHLSTRSVEFNSSVDSVIVKTGGSAWWIMGISVEGKDSSFVLATDPQPDGYSIKLDGFDVVRRDRNTLFIKVEANPNPVTKVLNISLQAGDYFDRVTVTQKAK